MVKAEIYLDDDDLIKAFIIKGHSGYADYGNDIVCSAVSVLAQTCILGLKEYLDIPFNFERKEGFLSCILDKDISKEKNKKAQILLHTMLLGLNSIEENYKNFLKVIVRRWSECFL